MTTYKTQDLLRRQGGAAVPPPPPPTTTRNQRPVQKGGPQNHSSQESREQLKLFQESILQPQNSNFMNLFLCSRFTRLTNGQNTFWRYCRTKTIIFTQKQVHGGAMIEAVVQTS